MAYYYDFDEPFIFKAIRHGGYNDTIIEYINEIDCPETIKNTRGYGLLHFCIMENRLQLMSGLLALNKLPIEELIDYTTPLQLSVLTDKTKFTLELIKAGADVNILDYQGKVLLNYDIGLEDARLLLENGATATINNYDKHGLTPLHHAVHMRNYELVHLLLYYGAETDTVCNEGNSPFITAVINGDTEMQTILLEYESDFNRVTDTGRCLLELATLHRSPFVLEMINRGADVKTVNVFQWCLDTDDFDAFKNFWEAKAFLTEYYTCDVLHAVTDRIEYISYFEYILETDELKAAVQHLSTDSLIMQVLELTENGYSRQLAQKAAQLLMSYGVCLSRCDLYYIYYKYKTKEYEMDEFFRVILFMHVEEIEPDEDGILLSIVFSTSTNLYALIDFHMFRISEDTFQRYQMEIEELTRYFVHPKLHKVALHHATEGNIIIDENVMKKLTNNLPSLLELARNQVRHFIHSNFKIRNACQFYTILEHLPLPLSLIEVLEFRRSIY